MVACSLPATKVLNNPQSVPEIRLDTLKKASLAFLGLAETISDRHRPHSNITQHSTTCSYSKHTMTDSALLLLPLSPPFSPFSHLSLQGRKQTVRTRSGCLYRLTAA